MNHKNFEKINIKFEIRIYIVCMYQISLNSENISFWDQICPKNTLG